MSTQIVRQISCFAYGIISLQGTGLHNKTLLTERIYLYIFFMYFLVVATSRMQ